MLAGLGVAVPAAAHEGTFFDLWNGRLKNCTPCHDNSASAETSGGLRNDGTEDGWRTSLVGAVPANEAAKAHGKLRVHEYIPWNSYLLDKLTGNLKAGEGRAMRSRGIGTPTRPGSVGLPAEQEDCPGAVVEAYNWILGGAFQTGFAPGDDTKFEVRCDRRQPALAVPPIPSGGAQADSTVVEVEAPDLEAVGEHTVSLGNPAELLAGTIEVVASAGTEYVTVRRAEDDVPLVVARGQRDPAIPLGTPPGDQPDHLVRARIALPDGVAIRLAADQSLVIEQRLRNDYWLTPGADGNPHTDRHYNKTTGRAVVTFHPVADAGAVEHFAEPFVEDTGTQGLFVPTYALGATGGAWVPTPPRRGAVVGVWTDQRMLRATLTEPAGAPLNLGDVSREYVAVGGGEAPLAGVVYACVHSNGTTDNLSGDLRPVAPKAPGTAQLVSRPLRWGCEDMTASSVVPPGLPGAPATTCHRSTEDQNDCAGIGTERCVPANLVGGAGVEDGRCSLVGVAW